MKSMNTVLTAMALFIFSACYTVQLEGDGDCPDCVEICDDGIDNDGDDLIDCDDTEDCSGDSACGCTDCDGDGYDAVAHGGGDCNDQNPDIHPGAEDVCGDGLDSDCDGSNDRCEDCTNGFDDNDDGLVDCADPDCEDHPACDECHDCDHDGHNAVAHGGGDCNDSNSDVYPGAAEICDGLDNDCDGLVDEGDVCACTDCDGDGHNSVAHGGGDCNDANASIFPGAAEICDGLDNDCDGLVDEGDVCGPLTETNCSNGIDDDSDGFIDCLDSDCYGLSGCPTPGATACYRFTFVTPLSEIASEISVQGSQCTPGHGCTHWLAPLTDSEGNRAEEFSSSRLQKTLKFIDGSSFEVNVMYRIYGTEYWHCSYGSSGSPPTSGDPLFGTLTIEHTTATGCSGGWSMMATEWIDLGSGSSDCNVRTL